MIESVLLEKINGKWEEVVAVSGEVNKIEYGTDKNGNKHIILTTTNTATFIPYEEVIWEEY